MSRIFCSKGGKSGPVGGLGRDRGGSGPSLWRGVEGGAIGFGVGLWQLSRDRVERCGFFHFATGIQGMWAGGGALFHSFLLVHSQAVIAPSTCYNRLNRNHD